MVRQVCAPIGGHWSPLDRLLDVLTEPTLVRGVTAFCEERTPGEIREALDSLRFHEADSSHACKPLKEALCPRRSFVHVARSILGATSLPALPPTSYPIKDVASRDIDGSKSSLPFTRSPRRSRPSPPSHLGGEHVEIPSGARSRGLPVNRLKTN